MNATTPEQKRPRTAAPEVRRRQLIEATIECIAENGLTGTTMSEVTTRAGLSMGLVSFHFRSKENLLQETLVFLAEEHRARWVEALADSNLGPAAKLAAVMDAHFHPSTCDHTRIRVWFAFFGEAHHRAVYREKVSQHDTERRDTVAGLCRELAARENPGVAADEVASTLESLADGQWLSIMLYPDWLSRQKAKAQIHAYLRAVFPRNFAAWPGETAAGAGPDSDMAPCGAERQACPTPAPDARSSGPCWRQVRRPDAPRHPCRASPTWWSSAPEPPGSPPRGP